MEKRQKYVCSYDQAGNLVKTVPPAGVNNKHSDAIFLQQVAAARLNVKNGQAEALNKVVPTHTLITDYRYNTLNQVAAQQTPDAGKTTFWYDLLGRLAVSQNSQQALEKKYSYTLYDALGRIIEVGQKPQTELPPTKTPDLLQKWLAGGGLKEQITRTSYDLSYYDGKNTLKGFLEQRNLRNRVSYSMVFDKEPDPDVLGTHSAGTFYSYDIHGNVDTLLQDFNEGVMKATGNRFKKIAYDYDLISGKVNKVSYQADWEDEFYHKYFYDAENRLTDVLVSRDSKNWYKDARYSYYKHGPKAKEIIGQNQVMGNDYAYTLQGWLKGVNSTNMEPPLNKLNLGDIGADGYPNGNILNQVARDMHGFSLHYFSTANNKDYRPINATVQPFANAAAAGFGFVSLYNGNIAGVSMNIPILGDALLSTYRYDQINRLTKVNTYKGLNPATNNWNVVSIDDHREELSYDANGNILTYKRNGFGNNLNLNNYSYTYQNGTNKLIKLQNSVNNTTAAYGYDVIGNVTKDEKQNVVNNTWNLYGKLQRVEKKDGKIITYSYDAGGNRISKTIGDTTEIYVRDASGNLIASYQKNPLINGGHLSTNEFYRYGSNLLGVKKKAVDVNTLEEAAPVELMEGSEDEFYVYNYKGDVIGKVSGRKIQHDDNNDGIVDYYTADTKSATLYSSYGAMSKSFNGDSISLAFNGQRKSPEISPTAQTAEFWEYDSDIGRRWNIDPVIKEYESPYMTFSGNPILFNDADGDDPEKPKDKGTKEGQAQSTSERKFVAFAGARGGIWQTTTTQWTWHDGGIRQDNGKASEAGWYTGSEYSKILTPIASDLAGYQGLYSGPAGHNWTGAEKQNVANTKLGEFIGTGLSDGAANALAATAQAVANKRNFQVSGVTYQSNFNVEDMVGVGLLAKELTKGLGKFIVSKLPQGGATFTEYKALRGGTQTLDFIKTTNKEGQAVFQRISTEFHHAIITQRTQKAMGLPNWVVNNKINVWKLNTIQHSLIDPSRRQFLRAGVKTQIGFFGNMRYNWFTKFTK
jgi:YD repeat-containing protein